jgi:hypothetical protein
MKDNFTLRNELLGVISKTDAGDLQGQIAGNVSSSLLPHGLSEPARRLLEKRL